MKKEILLSERPEKLAGYDAEQYLEFCGNLSWYDLVTAMPSLVFVVTGWKPNGRENACLHSWSAFMGSGVDNFICILGKVNKGGHMYQSLKETKVCVLNFPSYDMYDRCAETIGNNQFETDEITASGFTVERAAKVDAPQIKECFLNIECEYLWEQELYEGSKEVAVAVRAVNVCMDSEYYDQTKRGRYGKQGFLFHIDQPTNPQTGEISAVNHGTLQPGEPTKWPTN